MSKTIKECLLCLRIQKGEILLNTFDLYKTREAAILVGETAAQLIRDAYLKDSPRMCGKHPKTLLASAIYLASYLRSLPRSQKDVGQVVGCTDVSIRKNHRIIWDILNLSGRWENWEHAPQELIDKEIEKRSKGDKVRCKDCANAEFSQTPKTDFHWARNKPPVTWASCDYKRSSRHAKTLRFCNNFTPLGSSG